MKLDEFWESFGLKASADGWFCEEKQFLDRILAQGPSSIGSYAFWLSCDVRSPKIWGMWLSVVLGVALAWFQRNLFFLGFAVWGYFRILSNMVRLWRTGRLQTGVVASVMPHPTAPGFVLLGLETSSSRVFMKEAPAHAAKAQFGRFEVLFLEEESSKQAGAMLLAIRPVSESPGAR